jgi:uncharacterized membrane protein
VPPNQLKPLPGKYKPDKLSLFLSAQAERWGNFLVAFIKTHWLGILNLLFFVYASGAVASPLLIHFGYHRLGKILFACYYFFCHQNPTHSFFVFGNSVAICARCLSIYFSLFFWGFIFYLIRKIGKTIKIGLKLGLVLSFPLLLDISTQFVGLRESNNLLRGVTGIMFAAGIVFYLYPKVKFQTD